MKWFSIFKEYNMKKARGEKFILIFTALSIFITTLISLMIPQITKNNRMYMENNIKELNGGDLMIKVEYPSRKFNDELKKLQNEGYRVTTEEVVNANYNGENGANSIGKIVLGDNDIGENEIILYKSIANNIKARVGDEVEVDSPKTGVKKYIVKKIEDIPYGVDNDTKALGYGKIFYKNDDEINIKSSSLVLVNGGEGEMVKDRLKNVEDGYVYNSLKDEEKAVQGDVDRQIASFSVISTMGYIMSIITVITTVIMMTIRRKRDFAILKMLSIPEKSLKIAMMLEISLAIIPSIIIAGICSFKLSSAFIILNGADNVIAISEKVKIILSGTIYNCILFFVFINISLMMLKSIKPLSIVRDDEDEFKKLKKKIVRISIIFVPIMVFIYSLYVGRLSTFEGVCLIVLFVGIFLIITVSLLKVISLIPFRNSVFIYGIKNLKKNFASFSMILLSITMTLIFLLIGFTLNKTIKDSINRTMDSSLPYNHMILQKDKNLDLDKILSGNKYIDEYSKFYSISGKVINSNIKAKGITINKAKEEEYMAKYRILEGEDLFEGSKDEVIISNKYKRMNKLNVGDFITIETLFGDFRYRIKGIYDGGELNSQTILKPYDESEADSINYIVLSNSDKWSDDIKGAYIASADYLSSSISSMMDKLLDIFKALCFLCIFSSLLFSINMVYINYLEDKKDETVIVALGIGKGFCLKYQIFKLIILVITSTLMSLGIYTLVLKIGLKLMLNSDIYMSPVYLLVSLLASLILSIICFNLPIRNLKKEPSYELLRE